MICSAPTAQPTGTALDKTCVILFSGGRGSKVLSLELVTDPRIQVGLVVNDYDDGSSTGEVRRFLANCLIPCDYRKNAARLARQLSCCLTAWSTCWS